MTVLPFAYAANISIMFAEVPYLERPAVAHSAGFDLIESWWPFAGPVGAPAELDALIEAIDHAGVSLTALNFYSGDMAAGERGIASRPDRQDELAGNTEQLIEIAERTGCRSFNLLYGQLDDQWTESDQRATAAAAVLAAAAVVERIGGTVLLEPLTRGLNGRYPLVDGDDVVALITGPLAGADNIRLLFDLFHLGSNGVGLVEAVGRFEPWIGHVQIADSPGRGEPGSGSLPIMPTLAALAEAGYRGVVAGEYQPTRATIETLDWLPDRAARAARAARRLSSSPTRGRT